MRTATDLEVLAQKKFADMLNKDAQHAACKQKEAEQNKATNKGKAIQLKAILADNGIPEELIKLNHDEVRSRVIVSGHEIISGAFWYGLPLNMSIGVQFNRPGWTEKTQDFLVLEDGSDVKTSDGVTFVDYFADQIACKRLADVRAQAAEIAHQEELERREVEERRLHEEEERIYNEILKPLLYRKIIELELKPWPRNFELTLYEITYCSAAAIAASGEAVFDYNQLWTLDFGGSWHFDEAQRVNGWDRYGKSLSLILGRQNTPVVQELTISSYRQLPIGSCLTYASVIQGSIEAQVFRNEDGFLCQGESESGLIWTEDGIDEWVGKELTSLGFASTKVRQPILDAIPAYLEDGRGCWSCENCNPDKKADFNCGHSSSEAIFVAEPPSAIQCPGFTPTDDYLCSFCRQKQEEGWAMVKATVCEATEVELPGGLMMGSTGCACSQAQRKITPLTAMIRLKTTATIKLIGTSKLLSDRPIESEPSSIRFL